ncbi:MAG: hypothetical protein ACRBBK_07405 [Paracoccaceae bacterium]
MGTHKPKPRRRDAVFQTVSLPQLHNRHAFQTIEHRFDVYGAVGKLAVAMRAVLKDKLMGGDGVPEPLVIHRFKPRFHVLCISKFSHLFSLLHLDSSAQMSLQGYPQSKGEHYV